MLDERFPSIMSPASPWFSKSVSEVNKACIYTHEYVRHRHKCISTGQFCLVFLRVRLLRRCTGGGSSAPQRFRSPGRLEPSSPQLEFSPCSLLWSLHQLTSSASVAFHSYRGCRSATHRRPFRSGSFRADVASLRENAKISSYSKKIIHNSGILSLKHGIQPTTWLII